MIGKLLAKLNDQQKKILTIVVVVLIALLFERLLLTPTLNRLAVIDEDIQKQKDRIAQDLAFLTQEEHINKESAVLKKFVAYDQLPVEEEIIASFLKKLETLSLKAQVTVAKVVPAAGEKLEGKLRYTADIDVSGSLTDIIRFMHIINTSDDLMKVVKYSLSSRRGETNDVVKSLMTIEYIVIDTAKNVPSTAESTP